METLLFFFFFAFYTLTYKNHAPGRFTRLSRTPKDLSLDLLNLTTNFLILIYGITHSRNESLTEL